MANIPQAIDIKLVRKYNFRAFMYVEYPHRSFWSKEFNHQNYRSALTTLFMNKKDVPLMLYVHIPFCRTRCFYCLCHTFITCDYTKIKDYLTGLFAEISLLRDFLASNSVEYNFQEVHLGGGSPTLLQEKEFIRLKEELQRLVDFKKLREFAIEVDPRMVDKERMKFYHRMGINRISLGVQDLDPKVQKAINRLQPPDIIENLLTPEIRAYFDNGINFDIIYGLPWQTAKSIRRTFERLVKISPDRICLSYLHYSPKFARHQRVMIDGRQGRPGRLPDQYERKMLFLEAMKVLMDNGYVRTGYDHFAKSTDAVVKAMQRQEMGWNALGVTAGRYSDVIGIGPSSVSTIGSYYFQNVFDLPDYKTAVTRGKFPVYRGYRLSEDDLIRRSIIQTLRNFFVLDFNEIEKKYSLNFKEYFKDELAALAGLIKDEIVEVADSTMRITGLGRQFADIVCAVFDRYVPKVDEDVRSA